MSATGLTLFLSYAHEDEPFRKVLEKHLTALRRERLVEEWHDRMIKAGDDWHGEIATKLDAAHIIILLISPDFMASRYIDEVEVERAMQRYEMGTATVIPVLVRPTDWQGAPFSKLQALPTDAVPISEWPDQDAAFLDVVRQLRDVCREVAAIPGNPANPYVVASIGDWCESEVVVEVFQPVALTQVASMRVTLVDKDDRRALVRARFGSPALGFEEKTLEVPLDQPVEDSMGPLVRSVSEQIPANALIETRQTGGGAEKLFIGGKAYYTTWVAGEVEVRVGTDRIVQLGRTWTSPEIPLDGWVKMVTEIPGVMRSTSIVTDYGRGKSGKKESAGHKFNSRGICIRCGVSRGGATALKLPCSG